MARDVDVLVVDEARVRRVGGVRVQVFEREARAVGHGDPAVRAGPERAGDEVRGELQRAARDHDVRRGDAAAVQRGHGVARKVDRQRVRVDRARPAEDVAAVARDRDRVGDHERRHVDRLVRGHAVERHVEARHEEIVRRARRVRRVPPHPARRRVRPGLRAPRERVDAHRRRRIAGEARGVGRPHLDPRHLVGERVERRQVRLVPPRGERPVEGRLRVAGVVAEAELAGAGRRPVVEREEHLRRMPGPFEEPVHLHAGVAAAVAADVVPVVPVRVGRRADEAARAARVVERAELDPAADGVVVRRDGGDAGHVADHVQRVHGLPAGAADRKAHRVKRAVAERRHVHPQPADPVVVAGDLRVLALQLDVVAHAQDVLRRARAALHVRVIEQRLRARGVDHARETESLAVDGGHVVHAAGGRARRDVRGQAARERKLDHAAVFLGDRVLARPVGMDVRRVVEVALDVVAAAVVARTGGIEVGEVDAARRERRAVLDRRLDAGVEGRDLRVLRLVGDVDHGAADDLAAALREDLPDQLQPGGVEFLRRRPVAVDVVRADLEEQHVHVARLVELGLDGVQHAAARSGDEAASAHAGVPAPLLGHRRARLVEALYLPQARGGRVKARRAELLHERDAPVAVGGLVALRDGVAHRQHAERRVEGRDVEVEPQAAAAPFQLLLVEGRAGARRAGRVEERGEVGARLERAVVPREQQEAPLRVGGVPGVERDLRAGGELRRGEQAEGRLRRVEGDPPGRAEVERREVERAHAGEGVGAVHVQRGVERHGVGRRIGERDGLRVRGQVELRAREAACGPVGGVREARVGRARPRAVRVVRARRGGRVLRPELDAHERIRRRVEVRRVARAVQVGAVELVVRAEHLPVGEGAEADGGIVGVAAAPAVERKKQLGRQHVLAVRELAEDLEAAVPARAGRVQRVVPVEHPRPVFAAGAGRVLRRPAVVDGVELDEARHGVVGRGDLPDPAVVAPHVELRDLLLLALRERDGQREAVEGGAGRVHVDPHRLHLARVLAHELDVVARLRDAALREVGSPGVRHEARVLLEVGVLAELQRGEFDEAVRVRGGDVVQRAVHARRERERLARARRAVGVRHRADLERVGGLRRQLVGERVRDGAPVVRERPARERGRRAARGGERRRGGRRRDGLVEGDGEELAVEREGVAHLVHLRRAVLAGGRAEREELVAQGVGHAHVARVRLPPVGAPVDGRGRDQLVEVHEDHAPRREAAVRLVQRHLLADRRVQGRARGLLDGIVRVVPAQARVGVHHHRGDDQHGVGQRGEDAVARLAPVGCRLGGVVVVVGGPVLVRAELEDREVRLLRGGAVRLESLEEARLRGRRLDGQAGDARVALPGVARGRARRLLRISRARAGHLHVPAFERELLRERDAPGAAVPLHALVAHGPDPDGLGGALGGGLDVQLHVVVPADQLRLVGAALDLQRRRAVARGAHVPARERVDARFERRADGRGDVEHRRAAHTCALRRQRGKRRGGGNCALHELQRRPRIDGRPAVRGPANRRDAAHAARREDRHFIPRRLAVREERRDVEYGRGVRHREASGAGELRCARGQHERRAGLQHQVRAGEGRRAGERAGEVQRRARTRADDRRAGLHRAVLEREIPHVAIRRRYREVERRAALHDEGHVHGARPHGAEPALGDDERPRAGDRRGGEVEMVVPLLRERVAAEVQRVGAVAGVDEREVARAADGGVARQRHADRRQRGGVVVVQSCARVLDRTVAVIAVAREENRTSHVPAADAVQVDRRPGGNRHGVHLVRAESLPLDHLDAPLDREEAVGVVVVGVAEEERALALLREGHDQLFRRAHAERGAVRAQKALRHVVDVALDVEPVAAGHAALRRDGTRVEVTVVVDVHVRTHFADDVRFFRVVLVLAVAAVEIESAAHEMDRALTDHSVADVEDRVLRRHVDCERVLVEIEVRQSIRLSNESEPVAGDR